MPDYLPIPRFPLPDDLTPVGTMCVRVTIPNDQQYLGTLIGLIDLLKWSRNFARDASGTGAATVSRTWQSALESAPIEIEGCDMPEFRINEDTCLLEVECGDGNWRPVFTPDYDPANDAPLDPQYPDPPPAGETNECLAAANVSAYFEYGVGNMVAVLAEGGVVGTIASMLWQLLSVVVSITQSQLWVFVLQVDWGGFNPATIQASFDAFDWDDFKNLIVCYFQDNGAMNPVDHISALNEMEEQTGEIWRLIRLVWSLAGAVGITLLTKWGGIESADCDSCIECEWTHLFDFTTGDHDWEVQEVFAGNAGILTGGGWVSDDLQQPAGNYYRGVWIKRAFTETVIRRIKVVFDYTYGVTTSPTSGANGISGDGVSLSGIPFSDVVDGVDLEHIWEGEESLIEIASQIFSSYMASPTFGGSVTLKSIEVCGMGTNPFV